MRNRNAGGWKFNNTCCGTIDQWTTWLRRRFRAMELDAILTNIERFVPDDLVERLRERSSDPNASRIPLSTLLRLKAAIETQPVASR